jgi:hypothetical protein
MHFHFVMDDSILSWKSTTSKLASFSIFFALMSDDILQFPQLDCLGFLALIFKDFHDSSTSFSFYSFEKDFMFVHYHHLDIWHLHMNTKCFHYSLLLKEIQSCIYHFLEFLVSLVHWASDELKQWCRCREFKLIRVLLIALVVGAIWWGMLCFLSKWWSWQLLMVFNGKFWRLCVHCWQATSWSHLILMPTLIELDWRLELCRWMENIQL